MRKKKSSFPTPKYTAWRYEVEVDINTIPTAQDLYKKLFDKFIDKEISNDLIEGIFSEAISWCKEQVRAGLINDFNYIRVLTNQPEGKIYVLGSATIWQEIG
jgi:hypothetical protein